MIRFRCKCSNFLNVADEMSGESVQCPKCGVLIDVPTLDDLVNLSEDGTFQIGKPQSPMAHRDGRRRDAPSVTNRQDHNDRRLTVEQFLEQDKHVDAVNRPTPRAKLLYDPLTGELVEPLAVKAKQPKAQPAPDAPHDLAPIGRPMGRPMRVLGYARAGAIGTLPTDLPAASFFSLWLRLFAPANLLVTVIVTAVLAGSIFVACLPVAGILFLFFIALPLLCVTIAHFANVIDETGPTARDELPAPGRHVSLYDDVIGPLFRLIQAFGLAFLPMLVIYFLGLKLPPVAWMGVYLACFIPLPAILLTATCSGYWMNVLPHRSLPLMWLTRASYLWSIATVFVGIHLFAIGIAMNISVGARVGSMMLKPSGTPVSSPTVFGLSYALELALCVPVLFAGVLVLHAAGWTLGLIYRRYHATFPWLMQRHISTRNDATTQLLNMRRQGAIPPTSGQAPKPDASTLNPGPIR